MLTPSPPFRLDLTVWALRRRPDNIVDRWEDGTYRRALVIENQPVEIAVTQIGPPDVPLLQVKATADQLPAEIEPAVTDFIDWTLGIHRDLTGFYHLAEQDVILDLLADRFRGMRPPRYPSLFECLVNAVACQQVTLTLGIRLLNRLVERHGIPVGSDVVARAFPRPEDLADVAPESLRDLQFSRQKARAVVELAQAYVSGAFDPRELNTLDDEAAVARLIELRGIGRWSAEYALLRGMGRLEVFPGDDVGARKNLRNWLDIAGPLDYDGVHQTLERWEPYAGLVYLHLLLDRLAGAGYVEGNGVS
ncbi:DNA-3-methyladenine glycosylase family protein [Nitrolancea hollandica]|nr:DNA-3-methyladenine glycosylase 2 family protein [Nitrolancea hollandica]